MTDRIQIPVDGVLPIRLRDEALAHEVAEAVALLLAMRPTSRYDRSEAIRDILQEGAARIKDKARRAGAKAPTSRYVEVLPAQHGKHKTVSRK